MRLPFFRSKAETAAPAVANPRRGAKAASAAVDEGPVQAARTQARRRLIGALVLLAAGVIGFPLLFETQPRPLPVDTPILLAPGATARPTAAAGQRPTAAGPRVPPALPPDAGTETAAAPAPAPVPAPPAAVAMTPAAGTTAAAAASSTKPAVQPSAASAPPSAPRSATATLPAPPTSKPTAAIAPAAQPVAARPALAASAGAAPGAAADTPGRYVVQVGAYNDVERLKAARQRLDKLGYKSFTQDVETASGKRTRVRLGPFTSRTEAEAAAGRVKAAGMQANVLSL